MSRRSPCLSPSKETCKKGAEREQCGQLRRAVSDCDILGSIQLAGNMQRALDRCEEVSGLIDQVGIAGITVGLCSRAFFPARVSIVGRAVFAGWHLTRMRAFRTR